MMQSRDRYSDLGESPIGAHRLLAAGALDWWPDGVVLMEEDHATRSGERIVYANRSFERITGYSEQELRGRSPVMLTIAGIDRSLVHSSRSTMPRNRVGAVRLTLRPKIGNPKVVEVREFALPDSDDRPSRTVLICRELGEEIRAEEDAGQLQQDLLVAIKGAQSRHDALQSIVMRMLDELEWDVGEAWLPRRDGKTFVSGPHACRDAHLLNDFVSSRRSVKSAPETHLVTRASRGVPVWLDDAAQDGEEDGHRSIEARRAGLRSAMALPVSFGDEVVAVLTFFTRRSIGRDDHRLQRLERTLKPLGAILSQIHVQHEIRSAVRRQAALAKLSQRAPSYQRRDAMLAEATATVVRVLDCASCMFMERTGEVDKFRPAAQSGSLPGSVDAVCLPETIHLRSGDVVLTEEPLICNDLQGAARGDASELIGSFGSISILTVPVTGPGGVEGVLAAFDTSPCSFERRDLHFLQSVSSILSSVLYRHNAQETKSFLAAIVDSSHDAIVGKSLDGRIVSWNRGAERLYGYTEQEAVGRPVTMLAPSDRSDEVRDIMRRLAQGRRVSGFETVRARKDGRAIEVSLTISPIHDNEGRVVGAATIARDISRRKRVEQELARYREHLEELVKERSMALEATHEQLRRSERLASLGTLAAGLGHDLKNILFPVHCRLDSVERHIRSPRAKRDTAAIRESLKYLQTLSAGLRSLLRDPNDERHDLQCTNLAAWWREAGPLLGNMLPASATLEVDIDPDMPDVRIAGHGLTQVMLNLVANAAEAITKDGCVRMIASGMANDQWAEIKVVDDGTGMTSDVARRALEPFFTTKKRRLSTGLGLALVNSVIEKAGGKIAIRSAPGTGTAVVLTVPVAERFERETPRPAPKEAEIRIEDERTAGVVAMLLQSRGFKVERDRCNGNREWSEHASLLALEDVEDRARVLQFLSGDARRGILHIGRTIMPEHPQIVNVRRSDGVNALRVAIDEILARTESQ